MAIGAIPPWSALTFYVPRGLFFAGIVSAMDIGADSRGSLLRALLATATELSSLQDVESVLLSISRRTRELIGTDMAYISLNDHELGETYIRQSDGVVTGAYRSIRMPIGAGILGKVATGLAPHQTTDYLRDSSIPHLPEIDAIVSGEGVETIMGVPLFVGGRVIGALMVAERSPRVFSPEEIDIVDSLGKYAAIALDNAEKYAQALRDVESLSLEHQRNSEELLSRTQIMDFDDRLMGKTLQAPNVEGILRTTVHALKVTVALLNESGEVMTAEGAHAKDPVWQLSSAQLSQAMGSACATGRAQMVYGPGRTSLGTLAPVRSGAEVLGYLATPEELPHNGQRLLERAAVHTALSLLFVQAGEDAQHRQQSEVLEELLSSAPISSNRLDRRLEPWGLSSRETVWLALVTPPPGEERRYSKAIRAIGSAALVAQVEGSLCAVLSKAEGIHKLETFLTSQPRDARAAFSGPSQGLQDLPLMYQRAKLTLTAMSHAATTGVVDSKALGLTSAVITLAGEGRTDLEDLIRPLLEYDARKNTALTRTALTFCESDHRIDATAEALYVHRNTVKQRLKTIASLMGQTWNRSPRLLDIHLALRAWSITQEQHSDVSASLHTSRRT